MKMSARRKANIPTLRRMEVGDSATSTQINLSTHLNLFPGPSLVTVAVALVNSDSEGRTL